MTLSLDLETIEQIRSLPGANGMSLLVEIVDLFFAATPDKLVSLKTACTQADLKKIAADAHYLKGGSGNLGVVKMAEICHAIEAAARSGETATIKGLIESLLAEYAVVERELAELVRLEKAG